MNLLTAAELASAVRSGNVTAAVATQAALDRVQQHDARIGAFQLVRAEKALAEAAALDAREDRASLPLAGVPVVIKDSIPVAGEPMRIGSAATSADPQPADHELVARIRAAGSVPAGWHSTDGVPLGVQIVAPPLADASGEALILSLALQLERIQPWPRVAPGFAG